MVDTLLSIVTEELFDQSDVDEFAQVASLNMSWHGYLWTAIAL